MDFICISDTHSKHRTIPKSWFTPADCIIHAGDLTTRGYMQEIKDFLEWFVQLPYKHKIFVAGNHDFAFQDNPKACREMIAEFNKFHAEPSIIYLEDTSVVIDGVKIHGSPVQPEFYNWAFNRKRGDDIDKHWQLIPKDTDVLITHGPPSGQRDSTYNGEHVGCMNLANRVFEEIKPSHHIFGHIHHSYGMIVTEGITFINAATADEDYMLTNEPITFSIEKPKDHDLEQ